MSSCNRQLDCVHAYRGEIIIACASPRGQYENMAVCIMVCKTHAALRHSCEGRPNRNLKGKEDTEMWHYCGITAISDSKYARWRSHVWRLFCRLLCGLHFGSPKYLLGLQELVKAAGSAILPIGREADELSKNSFKTTSSEATSLCWLHCMPLRLQEASHKNTVGHCPG